MLKATKQLDRVNAQSNRQGMSSAGSGRVLIDTFDNEFLQIVREVLSGAEFMFAMAEEGLPLLEQVESYDVLICDLDVGGSEKLEQLQRIKTQMPGLSLIVVMDHPTGDEAVEVMELAPAACLAKPVTPARFLPAVRKAGQCRQLLSLILEWRSGLNTSAWQAGVMEDHMRLAPRKGASETLGAFTNLVFENLTGELQILQKLVQASLDHGQDDETREWLGEIRPVVLMDALHETINTLQATKNSFQSKELGNLRRRLETLVKRPPKGGAVGERELESQG